MSDSGWRLAALRAFRLLPWGASAQQVAETIRVDKVLLRAV